MQHVRPKKSFGQHFLKDKNIALKIINSLNMADTGELIEIGPGTGILTDELIQRYENFKVVEVDKESVQFLYEKHPALDILNVDFLKLNLEEISKEKLTFIGNLPYNISSQIFFKILEFRHLVTECVFMIQKEVAERICAGPGNKTYGILSVLLQAYFKTEYLFTVKPGVFIPPPKVNSGVIRLTRNQVESYPCDEKLFFSLVKAGFNHRRKTLRNSIKQFLPEGFSHSLLNKRAEELEVVNFVELAQSIEVFNR